MAKRKDQKMLESELLSLCEAEFNDSVTLTTEVQKSRESGLKAYNTELYGNEEDGLSKYVSSDVRDATEWIMPQLVDIFVGGDTPIIFEPENKDDVEDAETESRYVQYVFERQNDGVIIAIQWIKDALLQKNGIVKAWAQKQTMVEREEYHGKTGVEYMALLADKEFEINELTITVNDREYSEKEYTEILASLPEQAAMIESEAGYNIIGYRKKNVMDILVENVPPEQFFIQRNHNKVSVKDARYCGEFYEKTRSELIEMGYDKDVVAMLPQSTGIAEVMGTERQTRRRAEGGISVSENQSGADPSRELVMVYDHYIRVDFDGDGIAELRHVRAAGKGSKNILENTEVDRNIYHAITPYINNYRFFGRSLAENLMDLQKMKSQLWRNAMDNLSYAAIPRKIVKGNVDVGALMTYVQGGVIKADMNASVENDVTPFVAGAAIEMADKVDSIRAERSGFSKDTMGLNPSALANSTNPVGMMIMSQSQLLTKMIATIIANTGFKSLMEHLRELTLKYEDKEKIFDLTGTFLKTDPRRWRKQRSSVARVGIGFAGKQEEVATLDKMLALQKEFVIAQGGNLNGELTNAKGIYNTITRMTRRMGIKDAATYFQDPAEYKPPAPQPSIQEQTLQVNTETIRNEQKMKDAQLARDIARDKTEYDIKQAELEQKERLAILEMESRERLAHQELMYKYGKDAKDASQIPAMPPEKVEMEKPVSVNVGSDKEDIKGITKSIETGMKEIVKAQAEANKDLVKTLSRKRKFKRNVETGTIEEE